MPAASSPYFKATRSATFSYHAALPLLAAYELLIAFVNRGEMQQVRVGAEVWIKQFLAVVGATGVPVLAIGVAVIGGIVVWAERKRRPRLRGRYFVWMLGESLIYAVVLAFLVSATVGALFAMVSAGPISDLPLLTQLALSLGAGLYEELVFRILLVGGLFWIFRRWFAGRSGGQGRGNGPAGAYVAAAVVGALVFSAVHYIGLLGDPFALPSFTFRFLFGLALNAVYLLRGFGVAAWTHALYDVLVVTGLLG
jgi:membrane protease YdiL (CAAX protease family)